MHFFGGFDLAVTCFSGRPAPLFHARRDRTASPRVDAGGLLARGDSCGYWPGVGAEGAFYSYSYPEPDGYPDEQVPDGAGYDRELGEFILPYERVRSRATRTACSSTSSNSRTRRPRTVATGTGARSSGRNAAWAGPGFAVTPLAYDQRTLVDRR